MPRVRAFLGHSLIVVVVDNVAELRAISDCSCFKSKLKIYLFQLPFNIQQSFINFSGFMLCVRFTV